MRDDIDPSKITSWADLWNPEFKGKVLLTSDARGGVPHCIDIRWKITKHHEIEEDIKAAYERLVKLLPNVVTFNLTRQKFRLFTEASIGML